MAASTVRPCHHIEKKWLYVEIESLVFQEELGHETEMLTVHFVFLSVDFKH